MPALRQTSSTVVPSSACRKMKAICCSLNRDLFMENPPPASWTGKVVMAKLTYTRLLRCKAGGGQRSPPRRSRRTRGPPLRHTTQREAAFRSYRRDDDHPRRPFLSYQVTTTLPFHLMI